MTDLSNNLKDTKHRSRENQARKDLHKTEIDMILRLINHQ